MGKRKYRPNILLIFFCISILILILAPFVFSKFDGENIGHVHIFTHLKVGLLGNWQEYRLFYGSHDAIVTGTASDIGSDNTTILVFLVFFLVFTLCGSILSGKMEVISEEQNPTQIFQRYNIIRLTGSIISIISGIFGILCIVMFSIFKSSITQPYAGYDPSNIPEIRFAYGFYIILAISIIFILTGIIYAINSIRNLRNFQVLDE